VTEKLKRTFELGILPIVQGPRDYTNFIPTNHSIIKTFDFKSAKELGDYINLLHSNDTMYKEYFSYKYGEKISSTFLGLWNHTHEYWGFCGLCKAAFRNWQDQPTKANIDLKSQCFCNDDENENFTLECFS